MSVSQFVYVIYIRTTEAELWKALTDPEFTRKYWYGVVQDSDWQPGSPWQMRKPDGVVTDAGEVVAADPPRHLELRWRNEFRPELKAEGYSRCTYDLVQDDEVVKLTIVHSMDREGSGLIEAVGNGWPRLLSNLKSMLETGSAPPDADRWPA